MSRVLALILVSILLAGAMPVAEKCAEWKIFIVSNMLGWRNADSRKHWTSTVGVDAPYPTAPGQTITQPQEDVLLAPFDVVLVYDRGRGLRVRRGQDVFHQWLKIFDSFQGTDFSALPARDEKDPGKALDRPSLLPREPRRALELADRFMREGLNRTKVDEKGERLPDAVRTAIVVDHAQYLVPQADAIYLAGEPAEHLIRVLDWATDPTIAASPVVTCLIAPHLHDLNRQVVENPCTAKIAIPLPDAPAVSEFVERSLDGITGGRERCELTPEQMGPKLVGLSRANIRSLLQRTVGAGGGLTFKDLSRIKKDLIEKECQGLLGFVESTRNLDSVAGNVAAKAWLRDDAALLKQGATEGNLEAIFRLPRAQGPRAGGRLRRRGRPGHRAPAHQARLELMDLLAVEECTDTRFLPAKYRDMPLVKIRRRRTEIELA